MLWVIVPTHGRTKQEGVHHAAIELAAKLTARERVLPVFTTPPGRRAPYYDGETILQPYDRGSAPEILLALHRIESKDPHAIVVVLPAETARLDALEKATSVAIEHAVATDRCVLVRGPAESRARLVVAAPLQRLMDLFHEGASWLVELLRDFFGAASPLLPRTLEE